MKFRPPFPSKLPDIGELGLVSATEAYALRLRAFYNSRAAWHRRFYRFSGIAVILTGTGLPILASLDYKAKALVVSLAGTVVAMLTALYAFYRWDRSWILLRTTEMALTAAYWNWRSAIPGGDGERDERLVVDATIQFLAELAAIRTQESLTFFKHLSFPSANPPHADAR